MEWATLYPLLMVTAIIVQLWLAYLSWQRRETAGALAFSMLMLAVAAWTLFYAMELSSGDLALTRAWFRLRYICTALIPLIWLVFALQYTGQQQWLSPRPITFLSAVHIAIIVILLTNDWHHLLWNTPHLGVGESFTPFTANFVRGHVLLSLFLPMEMLLGIALLLLPMQNFYRTYRYQTVSIIFAILVIFLGEPIISELFGNNNTDLELVLPLILTAASSMILAFGFLRLGVLDVVPIAYDVIMNNIPDSVMVIDTQRRIIAANPAFRKIFYPTENPVGNHITSIIKNFPEQLSEDNQSEMAHEGRWYEVRVAPIKNWRRKQTSSVLILRDITESRSAQQSQLRYEALFTQAQDAITIETEDEQIIDANPAAERLFGYSREALLTLKSFELQPDERQNGKVNLGDRFEVPVISPTGERREVEVTQAPIKDGDRTLYMSILRDITERKEIEHEMEKRIGQLNVMRQLSEEISTTLDTEQVMIMALDAALRLSGGRAGFIALKQGTMMRVVTMMGNYPQDVMLSPQNGITGRVMRTLEPVLALDVSLEPDYVGYLESTQAQMVIPLIAQDALTGLINLETDKPERFDEDVFQFMQILASRVAVDIDNARLYQGEQTQRLETQQLYHQVRRLEQLKTDMIRIAAHDLKNPLLAITGHLELMEMDIEMLSQDHKDYLDTMLSSGRRMNRMIDDILSLERIEQMAKVDSGEYRQLDLLPYVKQAMDEYERQAHAKSQTFTAHIDAPSVVNIRGDHTQLYEAITNLINNAIKYTPSSGKVTVSLIQQESDVTFTVQDSGYGIPEDQQQRLFQPFYRAKTSETRNIEGTGLGLHLVKNIIERHKGQMIFESVYGEGSTFGFVLPLLE
ncbi:MAG: histidine kinase N-terminal 7TM domain-containing protein [Aggregatilineales bacterium]